jgi:sugar lactone lactonase YvrE
VIRVDTGVSTGVSTEEPAVECLLDYAAKTGESPTWSVREQALYWIDIKQPALHRFDPASAQDRYWLLPDEIGCFALQANGEGAVVALRSGLYRLRCSDGALTALAPPPFDPRLFRFNEGACDGAGRFWVGVMYDPKPGHSKATPELKAPLYSYSERDGLRAHADLAAVPNGFAWDAAYRTLFVSHSHEHAIYAFEFDLEAGRLGRRRLFATIPQQLGVPDGCAIDEDGCYWSAIHGGSRLRRFRPDGRVDRDLQLPVSMPTMGAFGGEALDTLYVTSESMKLDAAQRAREPLAGKLLRLHPGTRGRAPALFGAP